MGIAYSNKGMLDDAIYVYEKTLKLNPQSEIIYFNLGVAYTHKKMIDKAISSYKSCL